MTTYDLLDRLTALGCRVEVTASGKVKVLGQVERIEADLRDILHQAREALAVAVLTREAEALGAYLDGPGPYAERLAKVPQYSRLLDRLAASQERLYMVWREKGWTVGWDSEREVFYLTGEGPAPIGAESYMIRTSKEA